MVMMIPHRLRKLHFVACLHICLAIGLSLWPFEQPIVNADTTRDLQHAVHRLNIWLGPSDDAQSWRKFLSLNSLETQAARGVQANVGQLVDILNRFSAISPESDAPPFKDVRIALQAQIQQLSRATAGNLLDEIPLARRNYRQISITQLQQRRDKAVYDLRMLKQFYKSHLYSRERAEVYYDLKLDDLIDYLEGLQFELPPDVSVGKLNDQMSAVRKKLDDLESQRDQLPEVEGVPITPPQSDALNQEIERLNTEFNEIQQLRDEVRQQDSARQRQRVQVWRELLNFTRGFVEVAKRRSDYFFKSSYHSYSKFALLYFYGTDDNLEADYNKVLDSLEQELPKLAQSNDRNACLQVTDAAGWLEATELAPDLLTAIHARYSWPNVKISVSNSFVNRMGGQSVQQTLPVDEQLFGHLIRGIAQSDSRLTIDFMDDPNQAKVSLRLTGSIDALSHTQSGPVTAYTGAIGIYEGRQNIAMNVGGLTTEEPYVAATISSELYGVSSQLKFVQNAASTMYQRDRQRNESESARRLEERITNEFGDQVDDALSRAIERFKIALVEAVEWGDYIPEFHLYSTTDRIIAVGHKSLFELSDAGRVSNLAGTFVDQAPEVNADVTIQLHESLLGNYIDPYFVNQTFSNDQLAELIESLTGEKPEGLATDQEAGDQPWSITFANVRPIQLEFENNALAVTVTGRRFTQGDSKIQAGLKFRVPFKIKVKQNTLKLVRDGDATIDYLEPEKKTAKLVAFRSLLETKLNSAGKKQDDGQTKKSPLLEGADLSQNLIPVKQLKQLKQFQQRKQLNDSLEFAKKMRLVEFRMVNGWLCAGWNYVPEGDLIIWPSNTPAIWTELLDTDLGQ